MSCEKIASELKQICPTASSLQENHVQQRAFDQSRLTELEIETDELVVRGPD